MILNTVPIKSHVSQTSHHTCIYCNTQNSMALKSMFEILFFNIASIGQNFWSRFGWILDEFWFGAISTHGVVCLRNAHYSQVICQGLLSCQVNVYKEFFLLAEIVSNSSTQFATNNKCHLNQFLISSLCFCHFSPPKQWRLVTRISRLPRIKNIQVLHHSGDEELYFSLIYSPPSPNMALGVLKYVYLLRVIWFSILELFLSSRHNFLTHAISYWNWGILELSFWCVHKTSQHLGLLDTKNIEIPSFHPSHLLYFVFIMLHDN